MSKTEKTDKVTAGRDPAKADESAAARLRAATVKGAPKDPQALDTDRTADELLGATVRKATGPGSRNKVEVGLSLDSEGVTPGRKPRTGGDDARAEDLPQPGQKVGRYKILKELARGGMGVVYLVRDVGLHRDVALKVMLDKGAEDKDRRRFLREAEAAARLQHPNVCQVFDAGEDEAGRGFFTMEFIDGVTLTKWVRAGELSPEGILRLMAKVCDGVAYAHMCGVIHRDLKPANIFVDARGEPKVMDFGIAKHVGLEDDDGTKLTVHGAIMGTPSYMSPEQASGLTAEIDIRSDVYTLGVILYELLTGDLPFRGTTVSAILLQVAGDDPPLPRTVRPDLDWEIEAIVLKAMSKAKAGRYQNAFEMKSDIERYLAGEPIQAHKAGLVYRARKFVARNRGAVLGGTVAAAALAIAGVYGVEQWRERAQAAERQARELVRQADGRFDEAAGALRACESIGSRAHREGIAAEGKEEEVLQLEKVAGPPTTPPSVARPSEAPREIDLQALRAAAFQKASEAATAARALYDQAQKLHFASLEGSRGEREVGGLAERARQGTLAAARARADEEARARARREAEGLLAKVDDALAGVDPGKVGDSLEAANEAERGVEAANVAYLQAIAKDSTVERADERFKAIIAKGQAVAERKRAAERKELVKARVESAEAAVMRGQTAAPDSPAAETAFKTAIDDLEAVLKVDQGHVGARKLRGEAGRGFAEFALASGLLDLADYVALGYAAYDEPGAYDVRERVRARRVRAKERDDAIFAGEKARIDGQDEAAESSFKKALGYDASSRPALFGLAFAQGRRLRAQGGFAAALAKFVEAKGHASGPTFLADADKEIADTRAEAVKRALAAAEAASPGRVKEADAAIALAASIVPADDAGLAAARAELARRRAVPQGMVLVEAGEFRFGPERDARPRAVKAFYIGRHEVTNAEFLAFVRDQGYGKDDLWAPDARARRAELRDQSGAAGPEGWSDGKFAPGEVRLPVRGVSFHEAAAYAKWAGARLPTEVEWEKAAVYDRARRAKVEPPAALAPLFSLERPRPVGAKDPADASPSGIEDAFANVYEWCAADGAAGGDAVAVVRGGSFGSITRLRAVPTESKPRDPFIRPDQFGFRIARDAE